MYRQDIGGSVAHATMLAEQGIIEKADAEKIIDGLEAILSDIESGALQFDPSAEDVHMFVEACNAIKLDFSDTPLAEPVICGDKNLSFN